MNESNPSPRESAPRTGGLTTPLSARGWPTWVIYLMAGLGLAYIINPGMGIFELLPDNLPIIGNLDEGASFLMLWYGLVELVEGRKNRRRA